MSEDPSFPIYPAGTVRALLDTDLVTEPTRVALRARLAYHGLPSAQAFNAAQYATLCALVAVLMPPLNGLTPQELASMVDERLWRGEGDGWRYAAMPPDIDLFRTALDALELRAQADHGQAFSELSMERRELLARSMRESWPNDAPDADVMRHFLEELLAELCQYHYSHPLAQEEIGYVGMADGRGWTAIGLNQAEVWEPKAGAALPEAAIAAASAVPPKRGEKPDTLPPMRCHALDESVDVVVVGTGAGGAPVMARLAGAGLSVVALEAGEHWQPERDFATDEQAQLKLYWRDERLSAGSDPVAFGNNNSGIGVGGSTLHFTAYTPRVQPDDLRLRSESGVGRDWPLAYADLEPYYDELERFLGVSGPSPYPWGPPRRQPYPLPPLPLNGAAQLMQRACGRLGIRTSPAPNAALSQAYHQQEVGWRPACANRGFCQAGCSVRAKASTDVTFIPVALRRGAELRTGCFVTRIETDAANRVTGVVYMHDGREERQRCRALFLCAGAVETPRLLLLNGLANSSGQVGRNFMAHIGLQLWGEFEEEVRPYKGIPGGLISEETHRPADADFAGGYLLQSIGVMPVTYVTQMARGRMIWGDDLRERMLAYNHVAGINILGDCLPYDGNFLELSDEQDARGLPKPRIHFSDGDNERRMTAHAERTMRAIWNEAGGRNLWAFQRHAHIIGTCRMGADAADAVVNADGRAHDIANLYIVDNSVFPSALSANPALTIMALALRAADRFIEQTRRDGI